MNVDKMRRYVSLPDTSSDAAAWHRKVEAMTPEHRAFHEKPGAALGLCSRCINESFRRASVSIADARKMAHPWQR